MLEILSCTLFGCLAVISLLGGTDAAKEPAAERGPGEIHDYCNWEDFEAKCGPDEVIMMTSAKYGRMSLGRCVKRNYGYLGCAIDILAFIDAKCSGKRQCNFRVFDDELRALQPCPEDIAAYIEASYSCVKAYSGSQRECQTQRHIKIMHPSGYIATAETEEHGFGSAECPWKIKVESGQKINITLFNFARHMVTSGASRPDVCYEIAEIKETRERKRVTLCDALGRSTSIYVSKSNTVSMQFVSGQTLKKLGAFLFKYEVVGCPNIKPPPGGEVERTGNDVKVTCGPSGETRYLTCKGSQWIGDIGNCTADGTSSRTAGHIFPTDADFPYGILIVVSIGVALGVFFGGLLLSVAVMYMRRRQRDEDRKVDDPQQTEQFDPYDPESQGACYPSTYPPLEDTSKSIPLTYHQPNCATLNRGRDLDILKQSCPYGTTGRPGSSALYHGPTRTHLYESPKFV